eukprot:CAMPEP_0172588034 /NCGR_PEP_ID=MMETSP1068-20121228/6991_1 /TAXON_ID=35684 /ORGANISM="Pseudopedinella elastica, Strain CCMP716" /LENGTH=130 /DNA_ID=CAMNT_0013383237 /DNA_START=480 /DNA_END=872 /DNA_ORIENTATION=-
MNNEPDLEVFLCTAPIAVSPFCAAEKVEWVREQFGKDGDAWVRRLIITSDKSLARGDILIDDAPVAKAAAMTPTWEHVWFTQPYNAALEGKRRVDSWTDWRTLIASLRESGVRRQSGASKKLPRSKRKQR